MLRSLSCSILVAAISFGCGTPEKVDALRAGALSIELENELAGSRGFELSHPGGPDLEAYASQVSAKPGDSVDVFVNTSVPDQAFFEVYRLGYYQGHGGRLVRRGASARIDAQTNCPIEAATGLIECAWQKTFSIDIDERYTSGYYIIKVVSARGLETRVPLIVREAAPLAPIVVQASTNTWQAYNFWGGTSLYVNTLAGTGRYERDRAYRVSYDRPYLLQGGAGAVFDAEAWMVRWLEQKGYDVAYVTNVDVDREPGLLLGRKIALSVGHDEYNSVSTRLAFEAARDSGVSLAYFTANAGYWRVRHEPSSTGAEARVITCYKDASLDPRSRSPDTTAQFRQFPFARPEAALEGEMYQVGNAPPIDLPLLVAAPTSWVFEGTGVAEWERLANVVGPEWDQVAVEAPADTEILFDSPAIRKLGGFSRAQGTIHYPTDHSFVFAAGTIDWALGLGHPDQLDARMQRITENLLNRAGVPPRKWTHPAPRPVEAPSPSITVLAGTGVPGFVDGPARTALFAAPSGIAVGADGALYVTEVLNHSVRRIDPDGEVTTVAGCATRPTLTGSFRDGIGRKACFNTPSAIIAGPSGYLLVSDTLNHRVRLVDAAGRVLTLAGSGKAGLSDSADPHAARLQEPHGLALGADGSVYVAEPHHGALRRISIESGVSTVLDGVPGLSGVAVGEDDSIYLSNTLEGTISKWVDGQALVLVNSARVPGDRAGSAAAAALRPGEGLVFDGSRLVIADMGNYRIRALDLASGDVKNVAGDGAAALEPGATTTTHVVLPRGVTRYKDGYAIADTGNHRIVYVAR